MFPWVRNGPNLANGCKFRKFNLNEDVNLPLKIKELQIISTYSMCSHYQVQNLRLWSFLRSMLDPMGDLHLFIAERRQSFH